VKLIFNPVAACKYGILVQDHYRTFCPLHLLVHGNAITTKYGGGS